MTKEEAEEDLRYYEACAYTGKGDCTCPHCGHTRLEFGVADVYVKEFVETEPVLHVSGDASNSSFARGARWSAMTLCCEKCGRTSGLLLGSATHYTTLGIRRHRSTRWRPRNPSTPIGEDE